MFNIRSINQVRSQTPFAPSVTYIQDYMAIHNFNIAMVNLSIGLAQDLMEDSLIGIIRVSMTKSGYAIITKIKAPLGNTRTGDKEVGNRFVKGK